MAVLPLFHPLVLTNTGARSSKAVHSAQEAARDCNMFYITHMAAVFHLVATRGVMGKLGIVFCSCVTVAIRMQYICSMRFPSMVLSTS